MKNVKKIDRKMKENEAILNLGGFAGENPGSDKEKKTKWPGFTSSSFFFFTRVKNR